MQSDLDIYRAAKATIRTHGDGAALFAAQRADELMAEGDTDGQRTWQRIQEAIAELQRTTTDQTEPTH